LHELSADRYAENGGEVEVRPVFVRVLRADSPTQTELKQEASKLAEAIAGVCGRPVENVHVIFEPPGMGRIAFGGKLLTYDALSLTGPESAPPRRVWHQVLSVAWVLLSVVEVYALFRWVPLPVLQKLSGLFLAVGLYGLGLGFFTRVRSLERFPDIAAGLISPHPLEYLAANFYLLMWLFALVGQSVGLSTGKAPLPLRLVGRLALLPFFPSVFAYAVIHILVIAPMAFLPNLVVALYCFTPNGTKRASDLWSLLPVLSLRLARRETCC
jgi:phenylpyruvate tautomerase PptA (4-oxalocrotonate tautomerase family)